MESKLALSSALLCWAGMATLPLTASDQSLPSLFLFPDGAGFVATYNPPGRSIDLSSPFFQSLGSNGRSCGTCHRPAQGWSVSAEEIRLRFSITQGQEPIFRSNDGSNCGDLIDTRTLEGRRKAYSLLLDRGLFRIALPVPGSADFDVISVANPYGCNDPSTISVYRRTLPSTNLRFQSAIMWDGRESTPITGTHKISFETNPGDLISDLAHQALDATSGHAQGTRPLTSQQQQDIVDFEIGLVTAQAIDRKAGRLHSNGSLGGPLAIAERTMPNFFIGINDPLGGNPLKTAFTQNIFDLFETWQNSGVGSTQVQDRRASIARGEMLFNSKPIDVVGVGGLNDELQIPSIQGTCGTCHDSPNIGNHSLPVPLNIGTGDLDSPLDLSYLPVITLQNKATHEIKRTTDPGRALITGDWKDLGTVKGPVLRGLSSRAPYFHNGSARSLEDVVQFYNKRFHIDLTPQEKEDLVAFLGAL